MATKYSFIDKQLLTQLILDPTHASIKEQTQIPKDVMQRLEILSRLMCSRGCATENTTGELKHLVTGTNIVTHTLIYRY